MKQQGVSDKFLKGISTQTVVSIINAILQLIVFAVLSRILSKEDFGYYAVLMGITSIFMSISDAGIGSAVVQQKNLTKQFCSTSFSLSILFSLFLSAVFLLFSPLLAEVLKIEDLILPLRLMSVPLILHSVNGYATAILKRNLDFLVIGKFKILSYSISSFIAIIYALYGGGVYSLLLLFVLDSILYTSFLFSKIETPSIKIKKDETNKIIAFGGWLSLGVIMSSVSSQLDKVVLGRWLTAERLGAYFRPAGFILHIISTINSIFDSVLFPILSGYQDSKEHFKSLLQKSFSLLSTLGFILAFVFFFNSELIIVVFFGEKWMDLKPILEITSICAIFMLTNTLADCFFRSFNLVRDGFFIRFVGVFIYLLFLYEGARYDIIGVAVSVCLSNFIVVVIKLVYLCKKSHIRLFSMLLIWVKAIIPVIPIAMVGLFFYFVPSNIYTQLVKSIVIMLVIAVEFLLYPQIMGEEYMRLLYPKIKFIINRLLK